MHSWCTVITWTRNIIVEVNETQIIITTIYCILVCPQFHLHTILMMLSSLLQAENSSSCVMCPPGSYCEGDGNSEPTGLCDAGWFCTGGAYEAQPIVLGKYNANSFYDSLRLRQ